MLKSIANMFGFVPAARIAEVESRYQTQIDEINKRVEDFARIAIPKNKPSGDRDPAQWIVDRNEYVSHYRGASYIAVGSVARKVAMQEAQVFVIKGGGNKTPDRTQEKDDIVGKLLESESPVERERLLKRLRLVRKAVENDKEVQTHENIEEPVPDSHPLSRLFREVNPLHTQFDLWFYTIAWRLSSGDAYQYKVRNGLQVPAELWPLPPQWVWAIPSADEWVSEYKVQHVFGQETYIPAADMIHIQEHNLNWIGNGQFYGWPKLAASAEMVDVEEAMLRQLYNKFRNFAPPGMVFEPDANILGEGGFDMEMLYDIYQWVVSQHGMAEQTGKPMLTPPGVKVHEGPTMREMDYVNSLDKALEYTLAVHGVPKAVVGLVKDTNRANMEAAMLTFCENTVNPLLHHIGQHLTQSLAREFDENLIVRFPDCTVEDREQMRQDMDMALKHGLLTPNEAREMMADKMGAYKYGGDIPFVPTSVAQSTDMGNEKPPEPEPQQPPPQFQQMGENEGDELEENEKPTDEKNPFGGKPQNGKPSTNGEPERQPNGKPVGKADTGFHETLAEWLMKRRESLIADD